MLTPMNALIEAMDEEDREKQRNAFVKMTLEFIAAENDNDIMNDLMLDVIHRNASLNKALEKQLMEIERLSVTDQLTNCYNRRYFLQRLQNEFDKGKRYGEVFAVIMFDIDHFKRINDTYGHDVGDSVLRELSKLVANRLRATDVFARWGGEEFMILLPESTREQAWEVAEAIRKQVAAHSFAPVAQVTCSFGISVYQKSEFASADDLTRASDVALYEAKRTGRNKTTVY